LKEIHDYNKQQRRKIMKFINVAIGALILAQLVHAEVQSDYKAAVKKWYSRDTVDQSETLVDVQKLVPQAKGKDLYRVLILGSKAAWWKGVHETDVTKKKFFHYQGVEYATLARSIISNASESYLWEAHHVAEIGVIDGPQSPLIPVRAPALFHLYKTVLALKTIEGKPGYRDLGYAAYRNLGQLEAFLTQAGYKGLLDDALEHARYAYDRDNTHSRNFTGYAKVLILEFKINQKPASLVLAKAVLNEVLSLPLNHFDPEVRAQVAEDKAAAQAILGSLP
jgi:hypothetical protein